MDRHESTYESYDPVSTLPFIFKISVGYLLILLIFFRTLNYTINVHRAMYIYIYYKCICKRNPRTRSTDT